MNAIRRNIPNSITCMNLLSGAVSIVFAFKGDFQNAFIMMLIASVFDFCDGLAARVLGAYSDMGKELDSLADTVSFGLAPSLILFNYMSGIEGIPAFIKFIPLIIAPFSALRLAKFNLDTRQSTSFIGLPTPANAILIGSLIYYATTPNSIIKPLIDNSYTIPILSVALSLLLISEIPMFSLKLKSLKWSVNKEKYLFGLVIIIPAIILALIFKINWSGILVYTFLWYIIWNLLSLGKLFK